MSEINVPRPEDESPELQKLVARQAALNKRLTEIAKEQQTIHANASANKAPDTRKERLAALVEGIDYTPPPTTQEKISALAAEWRDTNEAVRLLTGPIFAERQRVSREIALTFKQRHDEMVSTYYASILAAAKAHAAIGQLHRALRRSGVEPGPLIDPGRDLFGPPLDRANEAWIALRRAARDGFVKESDIPGDFL